MRKVIIGTPSYDGTVQCYYVDSLHTTISLCAQNGVHVLPVFITNDALVQRARNDLIQSAYETKVDDIIFIDADQQWDPAWILTLLNHKADVVGLPVRKKRADLEEYNVRSTKFPIPKSRDYSGLLEVDSVGTGFLRLSRKAIAALWESAPEYRESYGSVGRMVFDIGIVDGLLAGEDVMLCEKLKAMGIKVHVDPRFVPNHVGTVTFEGDFEKFLVRFADAKSANAPAAKAKPARKSAPKPKAKAAAKKPRAKPKKAKAAKKTVH